MQGLNDLSLLFEINSILSGEKLKCEILINKKYEKIDMRDKETVHQRQYKENSIEEANLSNHNKRIPEFDKIYHNERYGGLTVLCTGRHYPRTDGSLIHDNSNTQRFKYRLQYIYVQYLSINATATEVALMRQ